MTAAPIDAMRGVYDATRASALAGVPKSTLHYWARHDIWEPSIAREPRTRLWSWGDLVVLRLLHWLRSDKPAARASAMSEVRALAAFLRSSEWDPRTLREHIVLQAGGGIVWSEGAELMTVRSRQGLLAGLAALVGASETGPDLLEPGPALRILPGKLSGEPHIAGTRILTACVASLAGRGYAVEEICRLYPMLEEQAAKAALNLEQRLAAA